MQNLAHSHDKYWDGPAQHQIMLVIPRLKVIACGIVAPSVGGGFIQRRVTSFFQALMKAIERNKP